MAISATLQVQIAALQARINAVAATATPEDIVLLAKALDAIAGQVSAMDLRNYTDTLGASLQAIADTSATTLNASIASANTQITTAKNAAVAQVAANAFSRAEFHAVSLLF